MMPGRTFSPKRVCIGLRKSSLNISIVRVPEPVDGIQEGIYSTFKEY
jgi:hypothetical protein